MPCHSNLWAAGEARVKNDAEGLLHGVRPLAWIEQTIQAMPFDVKRTEDYVRDFPYTEDADVQVLSLPYRADELSMVVILPKNVDGLAGLEEKLTHDQFAKWIETLQGDRPVETYLPEFRMRTALMLSKALKSMGMSSAFSNDADFSAMSKSEGLKISEVIHQAFVFVIRDNRTEAILFMGRILRPDVVNSSPLVTSSLGESC